MKAIFKLSILIFCITVTLFSCKNSKKAAKEKEKAKTEKMQEKSAQDALFEEISEDVAKDELEDNVSFPDEGAEQKNRALKGISDSLLFKLERTPCFGRCPTFSISVFTGGYVEYQGDRNVEKIGFYKSKMSAKEIEKLQLMVNELDIYKLKDIYDANMTDIPSTIITYQYQDNAKVVVDRANSPEKLRLFEKEVELMLNQLTYEQIEKY